ncbi:conserved Plasmodium protein, unknown function [Plasmodium gallinaceum]|uniref:Uncharacterized protein n=1 Tax=Plasmodium gallinaceum TaxID=5849 RepID=A0A1J1GTL0_PLAGA|nr:conserved Plasmodium protein, unknown function [Plasmodium gallinaceum]CRG95571.1 conserved Plasmodium protein, unknown function [Plasmodium gallinaceum]
MEEDKIKNIYLSLKNKNKKEWVEMMEQLTKDQKRKLIFFIKKKNKNSLHKIKNIKIEKNNKKIKTKTINSYILVDYSNINYDLNLKNYIGRILRIYKLEDNYDFIKALHLYMNILSYIIFKKFSHEYKNDEKNKNLLIFLKKLFPFEFQKFEEKYNMRWSKDFTTCENLNNEKMCIGNIKIKKEIDSLDDEKSRNDYEKECKKNNFNQLNNYNHLNEQNLDQCNIYSNEKQTNIINSNLSNSDSIENPDNKLNNVNSLEYQKEFLSKTKNVNTINKDNFNILIKTEKDDYTHNEINNDNILNDLNRYVKKEHNQEIFKNKDIKKIMLNVFDEQRFEYRVRFRSIISQNLNQSEYKKFCDQREKLFKYKKKNFIKWIAKFTNINSLDLYLVNFFIFLFLDRLYLIIETYIRLNYCKFIDSYEAFLDHLDEFHNFDYILNYLTNVESSLDSNKLDNIDKNTKTDNPSLSYKNVDNFNNIYSNIIKENFKNFFLSIDLIYNIDIYYFKLKNKISFEKLIKIDISSYINESNIYEIIQFDKNKNVDQWKAFTNFVILQNNNNLKFQKFDCFSIFLIVRFKYYLEEFKENANIDHIYKTIKEEFDEIENHLKSKNNESDFEYSHLIPIYLDLQKEVKKVCEYIKFYGNLISFVNFIKKYINSPNIVKTEENEDKEYFDLSFFLNSYLNENVKKE